MPIGTAVASALFAWRSETPFLNAAGHLSEKPGASVAPVALGSGDRDAQELGGFLDGEAGEVPELYQLCFAPVVLGESIERFIHGEDFIIRAGTGNLQV